MATNDDADVGRRARQLRQDAGLTQAQFIERLKQRCGIELPTTTLSKIEGGKQHLPRPWLPCWSALDPLKRGLVWLAWGLERDDTAASAAPRHPVKSSARRGRSSA